ncbi:MAG: hypothetical protein J7502_20140, partial [Flavisolibacter sp.]|nr:hypothetical protein [Flavisolibacter sp.]
MRKLLLPIFVIALLPVTAVFSQTFSSFKSSGTYDQFVPVVFSTNNISMITLMRQDIHADRTWLAHGIVNITAIGFGWGSGGNGVRVDNFSNAVETDQNTGRKTGFVGRVVGDWSLNNVVVFLRGGTTYATNAAIVRNDGYFQDIAQMQSFSPVAFTDPAYGLPKGTFYADLDLNPVSAVFSAVSNGNVGIGLSNPQNKLDVKGKMHAQEVKVDMTGWSDYVLKKDYKRPSLEA